jgi:hypothetical protein
MPVALDASLELASGSSAEPPSSSSIESIRSRSSFYAFIAAQDAPRKAPLFKLIS